LIEIYHLVAVVSRPVMRRNFSWARPFRSSSQAGQAKQTLLIESVERALRLC
jgi:hypothetical protein